MPLPTTPLAAAMCLVGLTLGARIKSPVRLQDEIYEDFLETLPNLSGVGCIAITGTTSGTGFSAAVAAVRLHVPCLLLLNRNSSRSSSSEERIRQQAATGTTIVTVHCDLQSLAAVREAAAGVARLATKFGGLSVLALNAGVMSQPDKRTVDGFDVTMQTNHLSHFLLTKLLVPSLELAAASFGEARIVTHSSIARWSLGFGTTAGTLLQGKLTAPPDRKYYLRSQPGTLGGGLDKLSDRYHQSKLANAVFAMALHAKLPNSIKAISAAPGISSTNLVTQVGDHFGYQTAADGSCPLLAAMFAPDALSGDMYEPEGLAGGWLPGPALFGWPMKVIRAGVPEWSIKDGMTCSEESRTKVWSFTEEALGESFTLGQ